VEAVPPSAVLRKERFQEMFKFSSYIFKNMRRNLVRTALTILGVGLAAFIVIYLVAVFDSRDRVVEQSADTLLVMGEKDVY